LRDSRRVESELIAHIAEADQRRLYAREACPSMFDYCTRMLHLSEHEAYLRIAVARASREHPTLLEMLADGRLHLSGIAKLAPHLTRENRESLLRRAAHKSKRQIEELVAELSPRPEIPAVMRKLPASKVEPRPSVELRPEQVEAPARGLGPDRVPPAPAPVQPPAVEPLAPARYKVQFTASAELHEKLERLRDLMRSSVPDGDLAKIIEAAVTEKLERLEAKRYAKTKAPRKSLRETKTAPSSRQVPAAVRRAVYARDKGQCTFVDALGRRCRARERLEFHHQRPFGRGGDHSAENVRLACRAHNRHWAEHDYGKEVMARYGRSPDCVSEPAAVYPPAPGTFGITVRGGRSKSKAAMEPALGLEPRTC
jgi:5-methylcytosine-specific restriction endonuclease McrA